MVGTTTTPSASVASRAVARSPFNTVPVSASIMTDARTPAASPNWTSRPGHVGPPLPVVWSASPNLLSPPSATRQRAQSQSCQTLRPPSPRSRRNFMSDVAIDTGVDSFDEVLVNVEVPRTGVLSRLSLRSPLKGRLFLVPSFMSTIDQSPLARAVFIASGSVFKPKCLFLCLSDKVYLRRKFFEKSLFL